MVGLFSYNKWKVGRMITIIVWLFYRLFSPHRFVFCYYLLISLHSFSFSDTHHVHFAGGLMCDSITYLCTTLRKGLIPQNPEVPTSCKPHGPALTSKQHVVIVVASSMGLLFFQVTVQLRFTLFWLSSFQLFGILVSS